MVAAAEAERARRVMVNGAGPAAAPHTRAPRYLFQSAAPYAALRHASAGKSGSGGLRRSSSWRATIRPRARRPPRHATRRGAEARAEPDRGLSPGHARLCGAGRWGARGAGRGLDRIRRRARRRGDGEDLQEAGTTRRRFFAQGRPTPGSSRWWGRTPNGASARRTSTRASTGFARVCQGLHASGAAPAWGCRRPRAMPPAACWAPRCAPPARCRRRGTPRSPISSCRRLGRSSRVAPDSGAQIGARPRLVQIRSGRPRPGPAALPYPQWDERARIK